MVKILKTADIWWVNLDPTVGDEIKKKRPVIILNSGHRKHLKLAIVVPITGWNFYLEKNPFFVYLEPDTKNGLQKKSLADCFQIRAISHNRFIAKIGEVTPNQADMIKRAVALILDISPQNCV